MPGMIYLASPYTHSSRFVELDRFQSACRAAATMLRHSLHVLSPIAHSHPVVYHGGQALPTGWEFWEKFDRDIIDRCDRVVVLMLDGWRESVGVKAEIAYAKSEGKQVVMLAPALVSKWCGDQVENERREKELSEIISDPTKRQAFIKANGMKAYTKLLAKR